MITISGRLSITGGRPVIMGAVRMSVNEFSGGTESTFVVPRTAVLVIVSHSWERVMMVSPNKTSGKCVGYSTDDGCHRYTRQKRAPMSMAMDQRVLQDTGGVGTSKCHCDDENARETTYLDQVLTLKKDKNRPKNSRLKKKCPCPKIK